MDYLALWMFLFLTIALMAGFPVTFTLMGTALLFGLTGFGFGFFNLLPLRIWGVMGNVTLMAVPLFVFMGVVLERSGLAEDLLDTMAAAARRTSRKPSTPRRSIPTMPSIFCFGGWTRPEVSSRNPGSWMAAAGCICPVTKTAWRCCSKSLASTSLRLVAAP